MRKEKIDGVYEILRPAQTAWVVFDSPHSGRDYPDDFGHQIPEGKMRAAEDSMVDDLFEAVPEKGGVMLRALFPRTYIDPNRHEDDIKREMISDPENWPLGFEPTTYSDYGHGLIRETLYSIGERLYDAPLTAQSVLHRVKTYHRPYHAALTDIIAESAAAHNDVWHVNCHSMPSACVSPARRTDFCLGDAFGRACIPEEFTDIVREFLKDMGYSVSVNMPFAGGRLVTDHDVHSLQIEINKAIYWDEKQDCAGPDYDKVKSDITELTGRILDYTGQRLMPMAAS